jgi:two-component system sensor histidine kinase RegB
LRRQRVIFPAVLTIDRPTQTAHGSSGTAIPPGERLTLWRERLRRWAARVDALDAVDPGLESTLAWLIRLRWAAVIGESVTVWVASGWFHIAMPLKAVLLLIGLTAVSNAFLALRAVWGGALRRSLFVRVLFFDIVILTALLACTGGLHNPFACFYLVEVAMAAVALGSQAAWTTAALATLGYGSLFLFPSPHAQHAISESLHLQGMFCATALSAGCIAYFAGRLNRELRVRERALGELRLLREQNERFAAMATLAAGVAHELGSPLGTIAVAARELERNAGTAERLAWQEDAGLIRAEVERCREILGRLNVRSTNELGEAPMTFPLHELIAMLRDTLSAAERQRIEVEAPESGVLFLPKAAVSEALRSLLRNAFDATPPDGRVSLKIGVEEQSVVFTVRDEGSGLSPQAAAHATEPFFTTKAPGSGMGLGLYLVRLLAERLGGRFEVRPNEGGGARAELRLPVAVSEGKRV